MLPICFTHGLALLFHYFKSITCVYSVMFSLQRRCMGVLCCYFRPKMFSPSDCVRYHSCTLGAHVWATVVGLSPNGPQFCHIRYIHPGGVSPVDHESAQRSRLEVVAVPQFALKNPCNPPHPLGRPSVGDHFPPHPGDRRALTWEIARGVGGILGILVANLPPFSPLLVLGRWRLGNHPTTSTSISNSHVPLVFSHNVHKQRACQSNKRCCFRQISEL